MVIGHSISIQEKKNLSKNEPNIKIWTLQQHKKESNHKNKLKLKLLPKQKQPWNWGSISDRWIHSDPQKLEATCPCIDLPTHNQTHTAPSRTSSNFLMNTHQKPTKKNKDQIFFKAHFIKNDFQLN